MWPFAHCAWLTELQLTCLTQESLKQMTAEPVLITQMRYGWQMTSVSLSAMRADLHMCGQPDISWTDTQETSEFFMPQMFFTPGHPYLAVWKAAGAQDV